MDIISFLYLCFQWWWLWRVEILLVGILLSRGERSEGPGIYALQLLSPHTPLAGISITWHTVRLTYPSVCHHHPLYLPAYLNPAIQNCTYFDEADVVVGLSQLWWNCLRGMQLFCTLIPKMFSSKERVLDNFWRVVIVLILVLSVWCVLSVFYSATNLLCFASLNSVKNSCAVQIGPQSSLVMSYLPHYSLLNKHISCN